MRTRTGWRTGTCSRSWRGYGRSSFPDSLLSSLAVSRHREAASELFLLAARFSHAYIDCHSSLLSCALARCFPMPQTVSDRNLLFGILALDLNFIRQDDLISA